MNIVEIIKGVTEPLAEMVPNILKEGKSGKLSSKRIFKLAGGGYMVYKGVDMVQGAFATDPYSKEMALAGIALTAIGVAAAWLLKSKPSGK